MRLNWRTALGFLISAVLVWWLVTSSGINWREAWIHIRRANIPLLILSSAASTVIFAIRAPRWRVILPPTDPPIAFQPLWRAITIGQMVTNTLPLRAGEFARAYALSRMERRVAFTTALASVVVDRVFDAIILLLLLVVAMVAPAFPAGAHVGNTPVDRLVIIPAIGVVIGLSGLFAIVFKPELMISTFRRVAHRVIPALEERGASALDRFAHGLSVLRSPRRFALVLWWTLLHWLVCGLSFWLCFEAIGVQVPLTATLFALAVIAMGVAIPSTPGFVGVFEASALAALTVYGVPGDLAGAWAVVYHVISWLPVTAFGLVYFLRLGLSLTEIRNAAAVERTA
jgi:uncharacterized protein (TIRG00374 family)